MLAAGVNFTLFYFLIKRKAEKVTSNEELRFYGLIVIAFTIIIGATLIQSDTFRTFSSAEQVFRDSLFTVSSIITTTGFGTTDYMLMKPLVWFIVLILMLTGASAGSTAGGIKLVRVLHVFKYSYYEFKRIIHPNAVFPVRYNQSIVKEEVTTRVLAFVMLYFIIIAVGSLILSISGMGFLESFSGMVTCISDVGPGLGEIGPANNFANIPSFSKWFMSFIMLVGRLELFTVLLLFTPIFWKK